MNRLAVLVEMAARHNPNDFIPQPVRVLHSEWQGDRFITRIGFTRMPGANLLIETLDRVQAANAYAVRIMQNLTGTGQRYNLVVIMEYEDQIQLLENSERSETRISIASLLNPVAPAPIRTMTRPNGRQFYVTRNRRFNTLHSINTNLAASISAAMENAAQSQRSISIDDMMLELRFEPLARLAAFGGKLNKPARRSIANAQHTSGLANYAPCSETLCGYQAVIWSLMINHQRLLQYWTGEDRCAWLRQVFPNNGPNMEFLNGRHGRRERMSECCELLALYMNRDPLLGWQVSPADNSTARIFVEMQPRYQVAIYNEVTRELIERRTGTQFRPETGATIFMSYTTGHLHAISGLFPYFARASQHTGIKWCHRCLWFKPERHLCEGLVQCDRCLLGLADKEREKQHCKVSGPLPVCARCDRQFWNQACLDGHHCRAAHLKVCEFCVKKIYPYQAHLCGVYKCVYCAQNVTEGHRCFIKRLQEPDQEEASSVGRNYYAFDLESRLENSVEQPDLYIHTVNLIVIKRCFAPNEPELVMDSLGQFINWVESLTEESILFAHNMSGYDGRMVFDYMFNRHTPPQEMLWRGSKIMKMTYGRATFMDTVLHLPCRLDELPDRFGLDPQQYKKGFFPYKFNTAANRDYVGPIPPAAVFEPEMMSRKKRDEFLAWHAEECARNRPYDFWRELVEYCVSDTRLLCKAVESYMVQQMEKVALNPFSRTTIASYAMAMYRTYYMPKNALVCLSSNEQEDIARAMHGGRTDARRLLREWTDEEVRLGIYGKYQDVQSLYPTVQFYDPLPIGVPKFVKYYDNMMQPSREELLGTFGFVCCDIECTRYIHHPVIVELDEECGRLLADLKPKRDIVIPTPELHAALENGYRVTKVHWIQNFNSSTELFKDYFRSVLKEKIEASGTPNWARTPEGWAEFQTYHADHLGIILNAEDMVRNAPKKTGAKLLTNSLWGKFGERSKHFVWDRFMCGEESSKIHKLENAWYDGAVDIHFRKYSGDNCAVGMVYTHTKELSASNIAQKRSRSHTNIAVAAMITSHARIRLWRELNKLGDRVLYHDTDSIIYEHNPALYNIPEGRYLGEWENEFPPHIKVTKFASTGPKCYTLVTQDSNTGQLAECVKVKGITLNCTNADLINFQTMKELVTGELDKVLAKCLLFKYDRQKSIMSSTIALKQFIKTYNKGDVNPVDWKVYPFGWNEFHPFHPCSALTVESAMT